MAIDTAHHRLFSGCRSGLLAVSDYQAGKVVATVAIGTGVDGAGYAGFVLLEGTQVVVDAQTVAARRLAATAAVDCDGIDGDACGAVAQGADGRFAWNWARSKVEAEQSAIKALGLSAPPFPDLGSASPRAAHVVLSACTANV